MEAEEHPFKTSIKSIHEKIKEIQTNPPKLSTYTLGISDIENKFKQFSEKKTPKPALSDKYTCIGRLKFYGDGMMFIYLEIADNEKKQLAWPVRATWKVELIDENDYSNNNSTFLLGEATCIFNKPKQGFVSHPNDWISVSLERLKSSRLIAKDSSVTMRWTVLTEPVLQDVYLKTFVELLNNAENYYDFFHGSEIQKVKDDMQAVNKHSEEHKERILKLETLLPRINDKVDRMEKYFQLFTSTKDTDRVNNHIFIQPKQSVV